MSRYVDLEPSGTPVGRCLVLPGRQYTPDGPLLFFAAQAALAHGWSVRQVWWEPPAFGSDAERMPWVSAELEAAVEHRPPDAPDRILVVGKSLGTLGVAAAAAHGFAGAWLTPLLTEPECGDAMLRYPAAQYAVIGADDPYLDRQVLASLPGEHLCTPGDHVLCIPGDPVASAAAHLQFVRSFDDWLGELA